MGDVLNSGARVALPTRFMGFTRTLIGERSTAWVPDGSSLQLLIEEYIALGASQIVVDANAIIAPAVEHLPGSLKRRVLLVDQDKSLRNALNAFVEPLTEEFGFHFNWPGGRERHAELGLDDSFQNAVMAFQEALYALLLGSKHSVEVEVSVEAFASLTEILRTHCRHPEMRIRLAALSGLLGTYAPVTFDAPRAVSSAPEQLVSLFEELTDDATYQYLSREARLFGIPLKCSRAANRVGRLAKTLVRRTAFKHVLTLGSAGLSAATGATVSSSEVVEMLGGTSFLPPFVSLRSAVTKAESMWRQVNPDYIELLPSDRRVDLTPLPAGETRRLSDIKPPDK